MEFIKYQHIERLNTDEVEFITEGICYIFPKIDGTNASVWLNDDNELSFGSRNRELSLENDNAGFMASISKDSSVNDFFSANPKMRLYGEWLVPHSLKTYKDDAWRKFYVFDVQDANGEYLHYEVYSKMLDSFGIEYIPPLFKADRPTDEQLFNILDKNLYLIQDNNGRGEGLVVKNYEFKNRFGKTVWAKIVTEEFKSKHIKTMGAPEIKGASTVERDIVYEYITTSLIEKTHAKIKNESGWTSKMIPRLLNTVYHDFVTEECWHFIKKHKSPTIDFKKLQRFTFSRIKELKPDLF